MPLIRAQLEILKTDLERISLMGPFQQAQHIWPVVWKLYALLAVVVEQLNNPAEPGKGGKA